MIYRNGPGSRRQETGWMIYRNVPGSRRQEEHGLNSKNEVDLYPYG